ncbi:hypothetical protein EBU94_03335 [bacterium]|nr:hypothetical protein [bacterium]
MKKLILGVLLFLGTIGGVFSQSTKSIIKTVNVETSELLVDVKNSKVKALTWDKDYVKIVITINASATEQILNNLFATGRYNVETVIENGVTRIVMPKTNITVKSITEFYEFEVFAPQGVIFVNDLKM